MPARRFALYFSWSRSKESQAELSTLENRFPALFEFRRAIWPHYEQKSDPTRFKQDIAGFLDHVILSDFQGFRDVIATATGHQPPIVAREADGTVQKLNDTLLKEIDTLIVVSLDHFDTDQRVEVTECESVRRFLAREGACLFICPHHDIGAEKIPEDRSAERVQEDRVVEFTHHGDRLVPARQRIGGFARSLLSGLGFPIENKYGLSPAQTNDGLPAPLEVLQDADDLKVLHGVETFNAHPHLPHLDMTGSGKGQIRVLARQLINPTASRHPFVDAGNRYFNALLWMPPEADRAGNVFVCDATLWSSAFGGMKSLQRFWLNLTLLPV